MAKLSVYNTIDRSQLGGKFVPLIQSGVNNYKILASDLGKEYHPGDAIEITDTGEINVNYDPCTIKMHGSGVGVRTDSSRGVFRGDNGVYIASANVTIDVTSSGISVNTPFLAGYGLSNQGGSMYVKSADNSIGVSGDGIKVNTDNATLKRGDNGLYVDTAYVSGAIAGFGLRADGGSGLSVQAADGSIGVSSSGIKVNTGYGLSANSDSIYVKSADSSIRVSSDGISVNIIYAASAIGNNYIGSGLYFNNSTYTFSANVNTATGIIVKDNKLYLNSGDGLQTSNNAVSVKAADSTIYVGPGIGVNIAPYNYLYKSANGLAFDSDTLFNYLGSGAGLKLVDNSLYVKSANNTISVRPDGLSVYFGSGLITDSSGLLSAYIGSGLRFSSAGSIEANIPIPSAGQGLTTHGGDLSVKAANSTIGVSHEGIKVNTGYGLSATSYGLYAKSADNSIEVSHAGISVKRGLGLLTSSHGLSVNYSHVCKELSGGNIRNASGDYFYASATVMAGEGLTARGDYDAVLNVYRGSGIGLTEYGAITVDIPYIANNVVSQIYGQGLKVVDSSSLYVKSADNSIGVSTDGIKVNTGYGLSATSDGLYVKSADDSIGVTGSGIGVKLRRKGGIALGHDGLYFSSGAISSALAGEGLDVRDGALYVKTGPGLGIDSYGYIYSTSSTAGPGLKLHSDGYLQVKSSDGSISVSSDGISVDLRHAAYIGSGLTAHEGYLAVNTSYLTDGGNLRVASTGYLYASATHLAGYGLKADAYSDRQLEVIAADGSIDVSYDGVKVNTDNNTLKLRNTGLYVDTAYVSGAIAGEGLVAGDDGKLNVKARGSSIEVSSHGIKVNPSALVGFGLRSFNDSLYVKSANNTISVNKDGLSVYYGPGLRRATEDNGQLSVYLGSGLYFDSLGAICSSTSSVEAGHGIASDGETFYIRSANKTLIASDINLDVNTDTLAGVGLGHTYSNLYVMSADNSIGVSDVGIKVNSSALVGASLYVDSANNTLNVDSSLLAGKGLKSDGSYLNVHIGSFASAGLGYSESSLYVLSADNSIDVTNAGIKVNTGSVAAAILGHGLEYSSGKLDIYCGSGLDIDKSLGKVIVKSADNSIDVSDNGIKVRTYDNQGVFAGNHGVYTRSADSSIGLSTAGIKVNVKSGGGILVGDQGLYIDNTSSSSGIEGIDVDAMGASATAGSGSVSVGSGANAAGGYSISVGVLANATANESVVIGYLSSANVDSSRSIAIGSESRVGSAFSVAIGNTSKAYSESSVVIGDLAYTLSAHSIAIGRSSYTYAASSVAIGPYSLANGSRSIAIGSESYANSASTIAIGYSSSSGTNSVAIGAGSSAPNTYCLSAGYMSSATGTESVALGVNSDAGSFGVAIGSQSNALEYGVAIGYNASATKGIISLRVAHSTGEHFEYKYGYDGSLIAKDTSGANYIRSWENLITPPDPSTKTTINSGTTYTADKPLWIGGSGYSGGGLLLAEFYVNGVYVGCVSAGNNNSDAFIVPVAKGDTYKINLKHNGGNTPTFFRMYCQ